MSEQHHFNVSLAKDYDVSIAIFLTNLAFWTKQNLANKRNIKGGFCWSYNTLEAFADLFPYWTEKNISYITAKAEKEGLLVRARLAKKKSDRMWFYALTPKAFEYFQELLVDKYIQILNKSREDDATVCDNDDKLLISFIPQKWVIHTPLLGYPSPKSGACTNTDINTDINTTSIDSNKDKNTYKKSYEVRSSNGFNKVSSMNNSTPKYYPDASEYKPAESARHCSSILQEYISEKKTGELKE